MLKTAIGLEIHTQLLTNSKAFCACSTRFAENPNSNVCPVCLALPGALPMTNINMVKLAIRLGLLLHCHINLNVRFSRKSYFYPDLPKAYQITQYELPICKNGFFFLSNTKKITIQRIHMEEDSAKSLHHEAFISDQESLLDFNRAGIPLLEIVTEPDFENGEEVVEFLHFIRDTFQNYNISYARMNEGSLRIDVNVSVSDNQVLGSKVEIKNLNSFKFIKKAIDLEVNIQKDTLSANHIVEQQTKSYHSGSKSLVTNRKKESNPDYRYMPEPDLPEFTIPDLWVNAELNYINNIKMEDKCHKLELS